MRVTVLGLGRIGRPVLADLVGAGHAVSGFDVRPELRAAVEAAGATWADSAAAAAADADVLLTVLPGSPELRELMLGRTALLDRLGTATTWVDLTSAAPDLGGELAAAARERGIGYLDAPVGGGPEAARGGRLTLYVGGDAALLERAVPVLHAFADPARIHHVGPSGAGYLTKLIVNLLWFGQAAASGEALLLAGRAGLDVGRLRDVLLDGPAASAYLRDYLPAALAGDYRPEFGLDRCVEELDAVERAARQHAVPFDVSAAVARLYRDALVRFGPVDGELLGLAQLEQRAGLRLSDATSPPDATR